MESLIFISGALLGYMVYNFIAFNKNINKEIKMANDKKAMAEKILRKIERAKEVNYLAAELANKGDIESAKEYIKIAQEEDLEIQAMLSRYNSIT